MAKILEGPELSPQAPPVGAQPQPQPQPQAGKLLSGEPLQAKEVPPTEEQPQEQRPLEAAPIVNPLAADLAKLPHPSTASTPYESLQIQLQRLPVQMKHLVLPLWRGVQNGSLGMYDLFDKAAEAISDASGADKTLLFEKMKSSIDPGQPYPDTPSRILEAIGQAPAEATKFLLASKAGLPGMLALGAIENYREGPTGMALGAAEYAMLNSVFKAIAPMDRGSRSIIMPAAAVSLAAADGADGQDLIVAGAMGLILAQAGGPGNPRLTISEQLRTAIRDNKAVQGVLSRYQGRKLSEAQLESAVREAADAYARSEMRTLVEKNQGAEVGKAPVLERPDLRAELGKVLTRHLGRRYSALPLEQRVDMLISKGVPPKQRERLTRAMFRTLDDAQRRIDASIKDAGKAGVDERLARLAAKKTEQSYEKMQNAAKTTEEPLRRRALNWARSKIVDVSGNVKAQLLKTEWGKQAVQHHDLIAGSTAKAQEAFQRAEESVWKGLSSRELDMLNQQVLSRRTVALDSYRKGAKRVKHPDNLTGEDHMAAMLGRQRTWGAEQYAKIDNAATAYFQWMRERVGDLRSAGIISESEYKALTSREYSPREFINRIDPINSPVSKLTKISVTESGIHPLSKGEAGALRTDVRELAAQVAVRTTNRIMRNNANRALYKLAEQVPQNGVAILPKKIKHTQKGKVGKINIPKGFVRVDAMIDGKQQPILMDEKFALEWVVSNPAMNRSMANALRVVSGSALVRPLATGYNPAFILTNMPRDLVHVWLVSSEYSPNAFRFAGQLVKDLAKTRSDAWNKTGAYRDYIEQGGGMNFLTHQGLTQFESGILRSGARASVDPRLKRLKSALGHLNEFSEIWTRLALRNRALANGKTPTEATWEARNYLDFSQGGLYVKGLDTVIPYLNAATQAVRGIVRGAKEHPAQFAAKIAQLQALEMGLSLANGLVNPDADSQIPYDVKLRYWTVTTPFWFTDREGNKRHLYFTVRKDDSILPFTGMMTSLYEKYTRDRNPPNWFLKSITEAVPIPGGNLTIPTLEAMYTYIANEDFWRDRDIWTRHRVPPEQEFYLQGQERPATSKLARDMGEILGMSPARMESMAGKLFPDNPFTSVAGGGFKLLYEGLPHELQAQTAEELIVEAPFIRRIASLTHPYSVEAGTQEEVSRETNVRQVQQTRRLDDMYERFRLGDQTVGDLQSIKSWIVNESDPIMRQRLFTRLQRRVQIDQIFDRLSSEGISDLPSRSWWLSVANNESPESRAAIYYEEWRRRETASRRRMEAIASRVPGFRTASFQYSLNKLVKDRGSEVID